MSSVSVRCTRAVTTSIVVWVAAMAACQSVAGLSDLSYDLKPDASVDGHAGSGGTGGTGATGGSGGSGGSSGAAGSTVGVGGAGGDFVACATTPVSCDEIGVDAASQQYGCCESTVLYWCDDTGGTWQVHSKTCSAGETCSYDSAAEAMQCVSGAAGTGGGTACESADCTAPCADCDGETTNGCETNTNTDEEHCGVCDHSCQGGSCVGGTCQVTPLAGNQLTPWGLVVDANKVFWVSEGSAPDQGVLYSLPVTGGSPSTLADGQNGPVQVFDDTDYVYWTNFQGGGAVKRVRKNGTDLLQLSLASGPWGLFVDSTHVYWTNTSDGTIRRVMKAGGQPEILVTGESAPRGIAVDATSMYWTNTASGALRKANKDGSSVTTLASGQSYPLAIAIDSGRVYWTDVGTYQAGKCTAADGKIVAIDKDGSNQQELATGQACPLGLTRDDITLYWTNTGTVTAGTYNYDGTIMRMGVDGSNQQLVASGQDRPYGIDVNSTTVFWTNQGVYVGQGSVMMIAK